MNCRINLYKIANSYKARVVSTNHVAAPRVILLSHKLSFDSSVDPPTVTLLKVWHGTVTTSVSIGKRGEG